MADMAAAGPEEVYTAARAFAKQVSIDRSRKAIQDLNEAAELLRSQSDLLSAAGPDDSGDEALPTPEMNQIAVQRFLSRRLSRQSSRTSSSCIAPPSAEAPTGAANGATTPAADNGGRAGGIEDVLQRTATGVEATAPERGLLSRPGSDRHRATTASEEEQGEPPLPTVPTL